MDYPEIVFIERKQLAELSFLQHANISKSVNHDRKSFDIKIFVRA